MNRFSRLTCVSLSLLPLAALAAPNAAIVPADAKWMVYADFSALRSGALGKEIMKNVEKDVLSSDAPVVPNIDKILATIGSATAYGSVFSEKADDLDGTLVVQGTPDLRKIADGLLAAQTVASPEHVVELTKEYGYTVYGIKAGPTPKRPAPKDGEKENEKTDEAPRKAAKQDTAPRDPNKIELVIAFPAKPDNIIIVSRTKALVNRARDLVNGSGASLAKNNASPLKRFIAGNDDAYLFAATLKPDNKQFAYEGSAQGRIFQMASSGSLAIGEHGADAFAHLEIVASSDTMADKLMKIVQGLTATLSLMETNNRQLGDFLNAASVARDGDKVVLNLAYPSARLIQMANNFNSVNRPQTMNAPQGPAVVGTLAAKWTGEPYPAPTDGAANQERSHTIEKVELKTGSIITLSRSLNGARYTRFTKVECTPVEGGKPMTFSTFQQNNGRVPFATFEFPGADGAYNLKITTLVGDPEGKIEYAVSVREPRPAPDAPRTK